MPENIAYIQTWTESESNWGQRPDGYSLHLSAEHAKQYVDDYNRRQPAGPAPYEYSFADGEVVAIEATPDLMLQLTKAGGSMRFWHRELIVEKGITGARTVREREAEPSRPFLDQCLQKQASPEDLDEFIATWRAGPRAQTLEAALGATPVEMRLLEASSANVYKVLYDRTTPANAGVK